MSPDDLSGVIAEAMRPAHFYIGPATRLEWQHVAAEDVSWEVFRGRLLDPAHTRQRRTFEAWNVYLIGDEGRSPEPLLSVKLDTVAGQIHLVRAIHSYAWEGYDAGGNVILSRETKKWARELVGTMNVVDFRDADSLRDDLVCRLFQAVVGTSRLPLTSVEAPLPAFTFGELGYFHRPGTRDGEGPMITEGDLLDRARSGGLSRGERARLLELMLRRPHAEGPVAGRWERIADGTAGGMLGLMREVFNGVSLSPYTELPEAALHFLRGLESAGHIDSAALTDFLAHLLRQIGRHLTAYDLVQFHHAGANYPDALLLDAVLGEYLRLIDDQPALFLDPSSSGRLRRRALRQAWLLRKRYRGHLVPDAPTSPGENSRVLPPPHARVPEEQFLHPHRRTKRLFTEEVSWERAAAVLRESITDLDHPDELRELGAALYLDRPLGMFKALGEPDQTPLLSYVAFSRSIALQRLLLLARDPDLLPSSNLAQPRSALEELPVSGLPVTEVAAGGRPGAVSLADARKAADDFVFLRTTASTAREFFELMDLRPLDRPVLIVGKPSSGEIVLTVYEASTMRPRLELSANPRDGYVCRGGVEYPRKGLRVSRVWEEDVGRK
jgi:hypothetical protein